MSDDYVRKDVVDEMRRTYEAQLAACAAENKAEIAALRGAVLAGAAAVLAAVQVFLVVFGTGGIR